jgi:hypothetical protein
VSKKRKPIFGGKKADLDQYVRGIADLCGLRDWTIRVDTSASPTGDNHLYQQGETGATAAIPHGRKYITITLRDDWMQERPDDLRQTIVHELMHAHSEPMAWAFNNLQSVTGGGVLFQTLDCAFDDAHEMMVDAVATAWAEALPLPVKPKKDEA